MYVHLSYVDRCFLFVIDASTTEIYTYVYTLALLDALPIFEQRNTRALDGNICPRTHGNADIGRGQCRRIVDTIAGHGNHFALTPQPFDDRSEEHTSELQSLMRISYAVFCLKKKTTKTYKKTNNQPHNNTITHCTKSR